MPIPLIEKPLYKPPCGTELGKCKADIEKCCFGCPATSRYKGIFW